MKKRYLIITGEDTEKGTLTAQVFDSAAHAKKVATQRAHDNYEDYEVYELRSFVTAAVQPTQVKLIRAK